MPLAVLLIFLFKKKYIQLCGMYFQSVFFSCIIKVAQVALRGLAANENKVNDNTYCRKET